MKPKAADAHIIASKAAKCSQSMLILRLERTRFVRYKKKQITREKTCILRCRHVPSIHQFEAVLFVSHCNLYAFAMCESTRNVCTIRGYYNALIPPHCARKRIQHITFVLRLYQAAYRYKQYAARQRRKIPLCHHCTTYAGCLSAMNSCLYRVRRMIRSRCDACHTVLFVPLRTFHKQQRQKKKLDYFDRSTV